MDWVLYKQRYMYLLSSIGRYSVNLFGIMFDAVFNMFCSTKPPYFPSINHHKLPTIESSSPIDLKVCPNVVPNYH